MTALPPTRLRQRIDFAQRCLRGETAQSIVRATVENQLTEQRRMVDEVAQQLFEALRERREGVVEESLALLSQFTAIDPSHVVVPLIERITQAYQAIKVGERECSRSLDERNGYLQREQAAHNDLLTQVELLNKKLAHSAKHHPLEASLVSGGERVALHLHNPTLTRIRDAPPSRFPPPTSHIP